MDVKFTMYLIYLVVSVGLTVWVGRTLFRNGLVFLEDSLGSVRLAQSVNHLLVVGFYLLNLGYVSVMLRVDGRVADATAAVEDLSIKVGLVLLVVGVLHFFNLFVLSRIRLRRTHRAAAPVTDPLGDGLLQPAGFAAPMPPYPGPAFQVPPAPRAAEPERDSG